MTKFLLLLSVFSLLFLQNSIKESKQRFHPSNLLKLMNIQAISNPRKTALRKMNVYTFFRVF